MDTIELVTIKEMRDYFISKEYHLVSQTKIYMGDKFIESVLDPKGIGATYEVTQEANVYKSNECGTCKINREKMDEVINWVETSFYTEEGDPLILQPYEHFILGQLLGYDKKYKKVYITGDKELVIRVNAYYMLYSVVDKVRKGLYLDNIYIVNNTKELAKKDLEGVYNVLSNSKYKDYISKYKDKIVITTKRGVKLNISTITHKHAYDGKGKIVAYNNIERYKDGKEKESYYYWILYDNLPSIHYFNHFQDGKGEQYVATLERLKESSKNSKSFNWGYKDVYLLNYIEGGLDTLNRLFLIDPLLFCKDDDEIKTLFDRLAYNNPSHSI